MLRIITSASVGQAKKYYSEGLTREGYYSEGQEMAGQWGGHAAAKLGLQGPVTKEAFASLCDNINPATGERLTGRTLDNRRVGYDFNFHAPKSVTLAYHWLKDERILTAFRESVQETMRELEKDAAARVRVGGQEDGDRRTGNLVWAEFVHFCARPVDGYPDPHLHSHCFTFNATFDEVEKKWKAGQFGDIKYDASYFEARFRARLAEKLAEMGYEIEPLGASFELAGISRSLIEKFSRRSKVVEEKARELGITTAAGKDGLAALTREKKVKELSISQLEALWWPTLSLQDKHELNGLGMRLTQSPDVGRTALNAKLPPAMTPMRDNEAVLFAIKHVFERASLVSERELLKEAYHWGYGRTTLAGIERAMKSAPLIRIEKNGQKMVTTMEVVAEEDRIIERCEKGKWLYPAINPSWVIKDEKLTFQQRSAVLHILGSKDLIIGIVGKSGAGKTTTLLEAARGVEAGGKKVIALAPSAQASRGTLRESGFPEAETIARLLGSSELQETARGAVWFVDEAGLMSSRSTDKLLDLAERLRARVVVVGDSNQHHSVERGDAFRLLQGVGKMSVVTVDQVKRQSGQYKQAVELWSQGRVKESLDTFERMGAFHEIFDNEKRYEAIARDYVAAVKSGRTALLVAPTHAECEVVTHKVRVALKGDGTIGAGKKWNILRNLSWTEAQRAHPKYYEPGLVVKTTKPVAGFPLGEPMEVVAAGAGNVMVKSGGKTKPLPLNEAENFSVYERDAIEVCQGDRIRITSNGFSADRHRFNNGSLYTVKKLAEDGSLVLENGWRLEKKFQHLEHGYATTSHSSQSMTIDTVLVAQSALFSSGATDANQFYVSVSRGRKEARIYTDNIAEMRENVSRVRDRKLANEVLREISQEPSAAKSHNKHSELLGKEQREQQAKNQSQTAKADAARSQAKTMGMRMTM